MQFSQLVSRLPTSKTAKAHSKNSATGNISDMNNQNFLKFSELEQSLAFSAVVLTELTTDNRPTPLVRDSRFA